MAEAMRNEVAITLAGEERTMRATFAAIRNIERDLGTNVIPLIRKMGQSDVGIGEVTTVIYRGLEAYGDTRLSHDEVGNAVMQNGITVLMGQVFEFLSKAMSGVNVGKTQPEGPAS